MTNRFVKPAVVAGIVLLGLVVLAGRLSIRAGAEAGAQTEEAVAVLQPIGGSGVSGTIHFAQQEGAVRVTGTVTGLTPGRHGFHVHEYGDLTDTREGESAGGHYNPTNMPHGAPESAQRHLGDLGNIVADAQCRATVDMRDPVIRLNGPHAVVGRAVVVHAQADKFTQPSGDAGGRVAFGVIGIAPSGK